MEQLFAPAMARVSTSFVALMAGAGIALEAIMSELMVSGEIERNYRPLGGRPGERVRMMSP